MKEYKIVPVRLDYCKDSDSKESTSLFIGGMKALFTDDSAKGTLLSEKAEVVMKEMSRRGWEVAGTAAMGQYPANVTLIVTFSREI